MAGGAALLLLSLHVARVRLGVTGDVRIQSPGEVWTWTTTSTHRLFTVVPVIHWHRADGLEGEKDRRLLESIPEAK